MNLIAQKILFALLAMLLMASIAAPQTKMEIQCVMIRILVGFTQELAGWPVAPKMFLISLLAHKTTLTQ
jgi:hypothetical protein